MLAALTWAAALASTPPGILLFRRQRLTEAFAVASDSIHVIAGDGPEEEPAPNRPSPAAAGPFAVPERRRSSLSFASAAAAGAEGTGLRQRRASSVAPGSQQWKALQAIVVSDKSGNPTSPFQVGD